MGSAGAHALNVADDHYLFLLRPTVSPTVSSCICSQFFATIRNLQQLTPLELVPAALQYTALAVTFRFDEASSIFAWCNICFCYCSSLAAKILNRMFGIKCLLLIITKVVAKTRFVYNLNYNSYSVVA